MFKTVHYYISNIKYFSGYLSDGDLLMSGSNGNNRSCNNDGYLSECGTTMSYSRRHPVNYRKEGNSSSGNKTSPSHHLNQNNNNKHGFIPEDR
jgi:hypothetical protein